MQLKPGHDPRDGQINRSHQKLLMKIFTGICVFVKTVEKFKIRQNVKTNFGMNSIVDQCVQKWNTLPQWLRLAKNENVFKKTLNDFLLSQHEKFL